MATLWLCLLSSIICLEFPPCSVLLNHWPKQLYSLTIKRQHIYKRTSHTNYLLGKCLVWVHSDMVGSVMAGTAPPMTVHLSSQSGREGAECSGLCLWSSLAYLSAPHPPARPPIPPTLRPPWTTSQTGDQILKHMSLRMLSVQVTAGISLTTS